MAVKPVKSGKPLRDGPINLRPKPYPPIKKPMPSRPK
jgi:hypothetical protein